MRARYSRGLAAAAVAASVAFGPAIGWAAGSSSWSSSPPAAKAATASSFQRGVEAVKTGDYAFAIWALEQAVAEDSRNADALNMLGYSHRKLGRYSEAMAWYQKALAVDPRHAGALEYQGELFLELGDVAKAERNLALLGSVCAGGCAEYNELQAAIADHRAGRPGRVNKSW